MRKIPTLFKRNPEDMKHVLPEVTPGCEWVLAGEGTATRKYDGTCVGVGVNDNEWALEVKVWVRREVKPGKNPPEGFWAVETDSITGKTVGWEPWQSSGFSKFLAEALADGTPKPGTYELVGPKVNGNPEGYERHVLVPHGADVRTDVPLDFDGLAAYLCQHAPMEGIVWHHPDGRMAKLKRRDFQ